MFWYWWVDIGILTKSWCVTQSSQLQIVANSSIVVGLCWQFGTLLDEPRFEGNSFRWTVYFDWFDPAVHSISLAWQVVTSCDKLMAQSRRQGTEPGWCAVGAGDGRCNGKVVRCPEERNNFVERNWRKKLKETERNGKVRREIERNVAVKQHRTWSKN